MSLLESLFPNLTPEVYRVTSPPTMLYNCLAWAAGENWRWWWPLEDFYWPPDAPREHNISSFVRAYQTLGYEVCPSDAHETGVERIALYAKEGLPTHTARQLPSGLWTSKIGRGEDIEHQTLEALTGRIYGEIACIMCRVTLWRQRCDCRASLPLGDRAPYQRKAELAAWAVCTKLPTAADERLRMWRIKASLLSSTSFVPVKSRRAKLN